MKTKKDLADSLPVSSKVIDDREKRERYRQEKLPFASSKEKSKLLPHEQKKVDSAILKYIIRKAVPLCHVDDPAFIEYTNSLNPSANVPGYKKLRSMIDLEKDKFLKTVRADLKNISYVCLTADMWSASHRSWFGMTAHWIDKEFIRRSKPICCKRMLGTISSLLFTFI